ncbi:unnamed protein product [Timema podura]|uniref:Tight junction-associated protein 1 n=1 Tax=Timema podura TaxID=61482 RepID=A0ABN7NBX6_TIMPD|nr:unnamed protein product [Timema podura]
MPMHPAQALLKVLVTMDMKLTSHELFSRCRLWCLTGNYQTSLHLHVEIENLKQRLLEREHHIVTMETNFLSEAEKFPNGEFAALSEELLTWQEKYSSIAPHLKYTKSDYETGPFHSALASVVLTDNSQLTSDGFEKLPDQIMLYESHKRVQKVNQSLEDKLLRIVDKCETEKTALTRDIASLTQKLADATDKVNQLKDENERYRNDVNLAIQLLHCKPTNFVSHKYDTLPADMQQKVRTYVTNKRRPSDNIIPPNKPEMKMIKVPIPTFPPTAMVYSINKELSDKEDNFDDKCEGCKPPMDIVSAAIMAKVLEERERERLHTKHCTSCTCPLQGCSTVEVATQTFETPNKTVVDGSNRASQGLVRYVNVVATRNEVINRNVQTSETSCMSTNNGDQLNYHDKIITSSLLASKVGKGEGIVNENEKNLGTGNEGISENNTIKFTDLSGTKIVGKQVKIANRIIDSSKMTSNVSKTSEGVKSTRNSIKNCDRTSRLKNKSSEALHKNDNKDMEMNVGNGDSLGRVSFPSNSKVGSEGSVMKLSNREGRSYLSEVTPTSDKLVDSAWARHKGDTTIDKRKLSDGRGRVKERSPGDILGPRPCSLRLQAGTSNILLDNATSYAPVLYTSGRHISADGPGRGNSTVLVHLSRSRSVSSSSSGSLSGVTIPTETEI